jgi:hypothetical protein
MASERASFSDEFAKTAHEEAARLTARAAEVRARGERWLAKAGQLLREAERLELRVHELDELLGRAPQLRLDLQSRKLQGQRLREEATRILLERRGVGVAIHYREWFELLIDEGLEVGGKDPLATFLTSVSRSPVVVRETDRQGVYRLDPHGAYERARLRVREAVADPGGDVGARLEAARRELDAVLEERTRLLQEGIARGASQSLAVVAHDALTRRGDDLLALPSREPSTDE